MQENFSIINKTRIVVPRVPFAFIKDDILGGAYSLSVAFVGEGKSRTINKTYRNKDKPTNILSFALSEHSGEIIICLSLVKREAKNKTKNQDKNFKKYLEFLVIHGMLHLKGMEHSSKMERAENFYCKKYDTKHFHRNRPRVLHHESSGRRILKRRN